MCPRQKLFCLVFAVTCFTTATIARADSIPANSIVVVSGVLVSGTNDGFSMGAFTFLIPAGQPVTPSNFARSTAYALQTGMEIGLVLDGNLPLNILGLTPGALFNQSSATSLFSSLSASSSAFSLNKVGGTFELNDSFFSFDPQVLTVPPTQTESVPVLPIIALLGTGVLSLAGFALHRLRSTVR